MKVEEQHFKRMIYHPLFFYVQTPYLLQISYSIIKEENNMKNVSFKIWMVVCVVASILSLGGRFSHNEKMMLTGVFMFSCLIFAVCILGAIDAIKDFLHQVALTKKRKQEEQEEAARKELAAAVCQILKSELK